MSGAQRARTIWRSAFFALFLMAPPLDIFRLDLTQGHFILFGQDWTLGIHGASAEEATFKLITRAFLPLALLIGTLAWVSWRWGRMYCGWLCPHFSVVEMINSLMRRASGKTTLWMKEALPAKQSDGVEITPNKAWWPVVAIAVLFFSMLWAVTLLTYLLPPTEVWFNLFAGQLSRNQSIFILAATALLTIEFTLARHLFCRFGCAVGLAQSLVWMGNPRSMVVGYDRSRASACASCDQSCEHACPMRLRPRQSKRKMFTCTQCQQCIRACHRVMEKSAQPALLKMLHDDCALQVSKRDFGHRPAVPASCFEDRVVADRHQAA